jgi:hypothetical protein
MTTGTGSKQKWTDFADEVIETIYPKQGAKACQKLLPDRSVMAIQQRAWKLRVASKVHAGLPKTEPLYPREGEELACDLALRQFRECEPAANLIAIIGEVA